MDTSLYVVNNHAPVLKMSGKQHKIALKPRLTKGILQSIKTKNRTYKNVFKSRYNFKLTQRFKKCNNIFIHLKNKSKINYCQKEFEQNKFNQYLILETN